MKEDMLDDVKRHLDYVNATNQKSIRDIEMQEMYFEIERLNKELKSLQDSYDIEEEQANYHIDLTDDLREEVDRLNNIINELEKWLYERSEFTNFNNVIDKLQELKGSDKE